MSDEQRPPGRRRGPKPYGRKVRPITLSITPKQMAALVALAEAQECSVSAIVRQMIDTGLASPVPDRSNPTPPDSN